MAKSETSKSGKYFLIIVLVIYGIIILIKPEIFLPTLKYFWDILEKIIPILVFVFLIMFLINYFITPKWLIKYLGKKSGIKSWFTSLIAGIISTGPIYMWYPMLAELQEKGVREGSVATFLYGRAIKPALIPLMVLYFGWIFTITLTVLMIPFSIIQGIILEKIMEVKK